MDKLTTDAFSAAIRGGNADKVTLMLEIHPELANEIYHDNMTMLGLAISCGWPEVAKVLIQHNADVNAPISSPLHIATINDDYISTEMLLQAGASVNVTNEDSYTPLHCAALWIDNTQILQLLLDYEAYIHARTRIGDTALHLAVDNPKAVAILIQRGAKVNAIGMHGYSPLISASSQASAGSVRILLENRANLALKDVEGRSAILHAAECSPYESPVTDENKELIGWFVSDSNRKLILRWFEMLAREDHLDIFEASALGMVNRINSLLFENPSLVSERDSHGYTALHYATMTDKVEVARILISSGADIESFDEESSIDPPLIIAGYYGNESVARLLLESGANPNIRGNEDSTALIAATYKNNLQIVNLLLQHGANANAVGEYDYTALHNLSDATILKLLIDHDVDVDIKNSFGDTPLHNAIGNPRVVKALIDAGADIYTKDNDGKTPLRSAILATKHIAQNALILGCKDCIDILLAAGPPETMDIVAIGDIDEFKNRLSQNSDLLELRDIKGNSLLHIATEAGQPEVVEFLIYQGIDPNIVNNEVETPLHVSCKTITADAARILLEHKANIDAVDCHGATPLHNAACAPNAKLVEMLISYGADINARIYGEDTPLSYSESLEVSKILYRHGGIW